MKIIEALRGKLLAKQEEKRKADVEKAKLKLDRPEQLQAEIEAIQVEIKSEEKKEKKEYIEAKFQEFEKKGLAALQKVEEGRALIEQGREEFEEARAQARDLANAHKVRRQVSSARPDVRMRKPYEDREVVAIGFDEHPWSGPTNPLFSGDGKPLLKRQEKPIYKTEIKYQTVEVPCVPEKIERARSLGYEFEGEPPNLEPEPLNDENSVEVPLVSVPWIFA